MGKLGRIARKLIDPLVDVPTLPGGRFGRFIERGLEELSSPVSLASIAAAPFTGGGSLAARGALAGRFAPALGRGLLKGAGVELAAGLGAAGASNLAEAAGAPAPVRLLAGLAGGIAAPGSLARGGVVRRGLRNVDEKGAASAINRADPTAGARASSPDFEVVGRGVGRSPNFQMLKPSPGKSPSDVLSRLPEKSELIIEPRRLLELEDNLPAQGVWAEFAPSQRFRTDNAMGTGEMSIPAMAGVMDVDNPASTSLGLWWEDANPARIDLELVERAQRGESLVNRGLRTSATPEQTLKTWRHVYEAGRPMRDALRKASGADEITLYRGQPSAAANIPSDEVADILEQMRVRVQRQNPSLSPREIDNLTMEQFFNQPALPPQIVESYSPLPEKAAAFSDDVVGPDGLIQPDSRMNTPVLARNVKIDDIVGTLGRTPGGTSEFVVLNPMTLSGQTMQAITGRVTVAPLHQSRVDLEQIAGKLRDVTERSRRGEFRGGLR